MHPTSTLLPPQAAPRSFRSRSVRLSSLPRYTLDYVLFLPSIWQSAALGIAISIIGPAFVVIPIGVCFLYAILMGVKPPRALSLYYGLCLIAALLSWYQLFPTSWQVHFVQEAIVRQLVPLTGFFAVAWASKAYFRRRLLHGTVFTGAPVAITLGLIVAPIAMYSQNVGYQDDHSALAVMALAGSLVSNTTIALFFALGAIFFTRDWRRYAGIAYVTTVAALTHFISFRLLTITLLATLCGFPGRRVAIAGLAILAASYAIGVNFIPEVAVNNPNEALRLRFMHDAFVSAADTYGVGVGYGKESVKWVYRYPNMRPFIFLPNAETMSRSRLLEALSTGVENSYVEALLRTGVLGCFLLVSAFLNAFPPRHLPKDARNHAAVIFFMIAGACFVNSALETPVSAVGIGFVYGYLLALRARARVCVPQIRWD